MSATKTGRPMDDGDGEAPSVWWANRQSAVELLELEIARHEASAERYGWVPSDAEVTLPIEAARLILGCAKKGLHKGHGRGGNRLLGRAGNVQRDAIAALYLKRKDQLLADPSTLPNAETIRDEAKRLDLSVIDYLALEEARRLAFDRYGLSLDLKTIKTRAAKLLVAT